MQDLMGLVESAESTRERGLAAFYYRPVAPCSQFGVVLELDINGTLGPRDLVCEVHLYSPQGAHMDAEDANWPFSRKLGAPYQYLPSAEGPGLLKLRSFQASSPFSVACIHVRPWQLKQKDPGISVRRCFATETVRGQAEASFLLYHQLHVLENRA